MTATYPASRIKRHRRTEAEIQAVKEHPGMRAVAAEMACPAISCRFWVHLARDIACPGSATRVALGVQGLCNPGCATHLGMSPGGGARSSHH
jgi:hypothetical protein